MSFLLIFVWIKLYQVFLKINLHTPQDVQNPALKIEQKHIYRHRQVGPAWVLQELESFYYPIDRSMGLGYLPIHHRWSMNDWFFLVNVGTYTSPMDGMMGLGYEWLVFVVNVGTYTSPMDGMGMFSTRFKTLKWSWSNCVVHPIDIQCWKAWFAGPKDMGVLQTGLILSVGLPCSSHSEM